MIDFAQKELGFVKPGQIRRPTTTAEIDNQFRQNVVPQLKEATGEELTAEAVTPITPESPATIQQIEGMKVEVVGKEPNTALSDMGHAVNIVTSPVTGKSTWWRRGFGKVANMIRKHKELRRQKRSLDSDQGNKLHNEELMEV